MHKLNSILNSNVIIYLCTTEQKGIVKFADFLQWQTKLRAEILSLSIYNATTLLQPLRFVINGIFSASVYRKATFISLFTNFDSFIPILHKEALISALLFRYFNISSSHAIFNDEVKKISLRRSCYKMLFAKNV